MVLEVFSRLVAIILLIILSPIFFIVIFGCMIFQGFPIFFKQKRIGYKFQDFEIYKFRSMINNSGNIITEPNDLRITKWGKFLRYTKIDELPQLLNILKGEMRFIGPRPEVEDYFSTEDFSFLEVVKPGISDFSSIILRDESKILNYIGGDRPYEKLLPIKLELANYYAKNKSFRLDLLLVTITIISLLLPTFAAKKLALPLIKLDSVQSRDYFIQFL